MKRHVLILFLVVVTQFISCTSAIEKKFIKSIESWCYNASIKDGEIVKGEKINSQGFFNNSYVEFDLSGNILARITFKQNGDTVFLENIKYNQNTKIVWMETKNMLGANPTTYINEYSYTEFDSIAKIKVNAGFTGMTIKNEYDDKFRLSMTTVSNSHDELQEKIIIEYKADNSTIERTYRDSNEISKTINNYNIDGGIVKSLTFDFQFDTTEYVSLVKYNDENKPIFVKEETQNDSSFIQVVYIYHSNGEIAIQETTPIGGGVNSQIITIKHDSLSNLTDHIRKSINGKSISQNHFKYIFDEYNNWVKVTEYKDDEPIMIVERTIKYY